MRNYYEILNINPKSSIQEIKRSFRKKAKEIHPDLSKEDQRKSEEQMKLLLKAYKILTNPDRREQYDKLYRRVYSRYSFSYREYLKKKKDDFYSQAKLIFYDLLNLRKDDAISLYENLCRETDFKLEKYLSRADFMDCTFLLAEGYTERGDYQKAYSYYKKIYLYELEKPYFHHFIDEIIDRMRDLVCFKMVGVFNGETLLAYLDDLIRFNFSNKDTAFFYKKVAEVYSSLGNNNQALIYLEKGLNLNRKLSGVKKLKEKISYHTLVNLQNT
ncbi:MAG: J domain-containing protein [Spirochaetales bacterium]|nr:J domain-containing protein [Spirochaetales bacterium]